MYSVFSKVLPRKINIIKVISLGEEASQAAMYAYNILPYQANFLFVNKPYFAQKIKGKKLEEFLGDDTEILVLLTDNESLFEPFISELTSLQSKLHFAVAHFSFSNNLSNLPFATRYINEGTEENKNEVFLKELEIIFKIDNEYAYMRIGVADVKKILINAKNLFIKEESENKAGAVEDLAYMMREKISEDFTKIVLQLTHGKNEPSIREVNALYEIFSQTEKASPMFILGMCKDDELNDNQIVIRVICT